MYNAMLKKTEHWVNNYNDQTSEMRCNCAILAMNKVARQNVQMVQKFGIIRYYTLLSVKQ